MNNNEWELTASRALVGRKIVAVRYMTPAEAEGLGWYSRPVVFQLDDNSLWWPSADDEGNNGGALFSTNPKCDTLPVL